MSDLFNFCSSHGLASPRYDYHTGRDKMTAATVHIGDTQVYRGSYAREKQQAAESAASIAMFNLVSQPASYCCIPRI